MNTGKLQEFLSERYSTHWTGLRNKILTRYILGSSCSHCNPLSSRPVGQTMQKTLKAKIQNALSLTSSFNDAESPALFVGGRRRNRKKRKNKNGQGKRKARRGGATEPPARVEKSPTPDSAYEDLLPIYSVKRPVVSCLDIREPVFYDPVTSSPSGKVREQSDSVYNSNDSLVSLSSGHDSGTEQDDLTPTAEYDLVIEDVADDKKSGLPRANSRDSGVFDDDDGSVDDAGYGGESADEVQDELQEQITDDAFENGVTSDENFLELFKDDEQVIGCGDPSTDAEEETDELTDDFDDVDLADDDLDLTDGDLDLTDDGVVVEEERFADDEVVETAEAVEGDEAEVRSESETIREREITTEAISIVNFPEDEDEIIFDLSQLEVNSTQVDFSKIKKNKDVFKLSEVLDVPTDLEEEEILSLRVPMDLLIDDDDNDEVLFEAAARGRTHQAQRPRDPRDPSTASRDPSITCNPLYEHVMREEEERLSIKSYQGGFKTDFDNVNLIQIPTAASSKTSNKPVKESSPLINNPQDDLGCCVIL